MRSRGFFGFGYLGPNPNDNEPERMEIARPPEAPATKSNTGNAAQDGYTVTARRLRGDMPGDMIDSNEADRIESSLMDPSYQD